MAKTRYTDNMRYRQNRKIVLKQHAYTCQYCGDIATQTHHIDFDEFNHDTTNLLPLCRECHNVIHGKSRAMKPIIIHDDVKPIDSDKYCSPRQIMYKYKLDWLQMNYLYKKGIPRYRFGVRTTRFIESEVDKWIIDNKEVI